MWSTTHESFFELSPLVHLGRQSTHQCEGLEASDESGWPDLVITGWTSGEVSAHRLIDGKLHWSWMSQIASNGITGKILVENTSKGWQVIIPTEYGLASLCPVNGQLIWISNFSEGGVGYRHSPTLFQKDNFEWIMVGNENGNMMEVNLSNPQSYLTTILDYGLVNPKIRGPIIMLSHESDRRLISIQGDEGSLFVEWYNNSTSTIQHQLDGSTGIMTIYQNLVVVPTSTNTTLYDCIEYCNVIGILTNESVTGEPSFVEHQDGNISVIIPHNINQGYWSSHKVSFDVNQWRISSDPDWEWKPIISQYLTAGVGITDYAAAVGNDASYIEVIILDLQVGKFHFETMRQANQEWIEVDTDEQIDAHSSSVNESSWIGVMYFVMVVLFIGIGSYAFSRIKPDNFRWPSLILLVALILVLPGILIQWSNLIGDEDSTGQNIILESDIPSEWSGSQIVIFEFPNSELNGVEIRYDQNGNEIERGLSVNNETDRILIGGLTGLENVWDITLIASNLSNLNLEYENTAIGMFVTSINNFENSGQNGWVYTIDTTYGTQSVNLAFIDTNSTIIWQYK